MLLGGGNNAWGEETLTINNGTATDAQIPVAGTVANKISDSKQPESETIIPKTSISALGGKYINKLTFYLETSASVENWGSAKFEVILKEVTNEFFPSSDYTYLGSTGGTIVYTGQLDATESTMNILFSTPFLYSGEKHLLIRINCTTNGTASTVKFYGLKPDYTNVRSLYKSIAAPYKSFFTPKVTFTYEDATSKTISASPNEAATFGDVYESKNKVYRITNNGSSSVNVTPSITGTDDTYTSFSVSPSDATAISAGGYQDFTFTFNYDSESLGEKSATLTFTPNDNEYNTIEFDATATAIDNNAPELTVSPTEDAAFGSVRANSSKTYTVTNSGTGSMTVSIESDNSTEFSVSKSSVTLGAGESTTFDVNFNFSTERSGDRSATITVTPTYDENDAVEISATATAITQPIIGVSSTYVAMGSLKVNGTRDITVSNTGYGSMVVNIGSSNDLFTVSPSSLTVAQDESETFTITFNYDPSNLGYKTSTITVTPTYDVDAKETITASATAVEPLFVSPDATTSFGNVTGNASRTYTITNLGTSNMDVEISLGGTNSSFFSLSETSLSDIPAGESRTFTATFNYDSESTGSKKSASIIVKPTGSSNSTSVDINATPQASGYEDITIDEEDYQAIAEAGTKKVKVLYSAKSGWNTFCVPFGMSSENMNYVFGSGCKYYVLNSYNSTTHEIAFTASAIAPSAGVPLLVYTESAPTYSDGVILTGRYVVTSDAGKTTKSPAIFQGTYTTKTYTDGDNWYGVTPAGKVMKAGTGAAIKGYRAYFTGIEPPTPGARISIVIEGDDETTDLGFVKMVDPEAEEVYNLQGQKIQKGRKGLYIVNGRKVVIK